MGFSAHDRGQREKEDLHQSFWPTEDVRMLQASVADGWGVDEGSEFLFQDLNLCQGQSLSKERTDRFAMQSL